MKDSSEQQETLTPRVQAIVMPASGWFETALLRDGCSNGHHGYKCKDCQPDGFCEACDSFEGRSIEAICEYASTCDGCGELVHHDLQRIPPDSDDQLGYCWDCRPDLFEDESA